MKKKTIVLLAFLLSLFAQAGNAGKNAVYLWGNGTPTCYKLEQMPRVKYDTTSGGKQAQVYVGTSSTPVLSLSLAEGKTLSVVYGEYKEEFSSVEAVTAPVRQTGKYIKGGKLLIVKDGKVYDANGKIIK